MRAVIGSNWTITSEIEVPMTTLDRLLVDLAEISLLKIDVQGYEKPVLSGAKETLAKTKFILIELNFMPQYDGGSWFGEVHQILTRDFGFFLANASQPQILNGRRIVIFYAASFAGVAATLLQLGNVIWLRTFWPFFAAIATLLLLAMAQFILLVFAVEEPKS